jgi:hypothetical protein
MRSQKLLLPDAKARKDVGEHVVGCSAAGDLFKRATGLLQVGQHEFL